MQETKQTSLANAKDKSNNAPKNNNNTAYEKVTGEKPEDVICQINNEFNEVNEGEKEILTEQNNITENRSNKLDLNITLSVESSSNKKNSNLNLPGTKRRNLFLILLIFFVVISGTAFGIFFGVYSKTEQNQVLINEKKPINLDSNSFFQEKIKAKAPEEPVIVRSFQVAESYLYHKNSKSVIYRSINATDRNVTLMDSFITFFIADKKENNDLKIFYQLHNVTEYDETKANKTTLVFDSYDLISRNFFFFFFLFLLLYFYC